jgi:hypothetical protein
MEANFAAGGKLAAILFYSLDWIILIFSTGLFYFHPLPHPRYMRPLRVGQQARQTASHRVRGEAPCQVPCVAALHFPKHCSWARLGKLEPARNTGPRNHTPSSRRRRCHAVHLVSTEDCVGLWTRHSVDTIAAWNAQHATPIGMESSENARRR